MLRLLSLGAFLALWYAGSVVAGRQSLPPPHAVASVMWTEAASGALFVNLGATLARVVAAFILAMAGGIAVGILMGRSRGADELLDAWLIILLNIPALVVIVLAYIWVGLSETAAILAVAINKLPNTAVTMREGARALDQGLEEMAQVFCMDRWTRWRHVLIPQLAPYVAAAGRSGLALVWKIVLVVELLGRPNGVGFEIGTAFQLFDVTRILAYAFAFVAVMLAAEYLMVQPFEQRANKWRRQPA